MESRNLDNESHDEFEIKEVEEIDVDALQTQLDQIDNRIKNREKDLDHKEDFTSLIQKENDALLDCNIIPDDFNKPNPSKD